MDIILNYLIYVHIHYVCKPLQLLYYTSCLQIGCIKTCFTLIAL